MLTLLPVLLWYYQQIALGSTSPVLLKDYAVVESLVANVDPTIVTTVIQSESHFNPDAYHPNDGKIGCNSRGLVQIRSCDHAVSDAEAFNPVFSVNFLIRNIDKCKSWWLATCSIK